MAERPPTPAEGGSEEEREPSLSEEEIKALEGFGISQEDVNQMGATEARKSLDMLRYQPKPPPQETGERPPEGAPAEKGVEDIEIPTFIREGAGEKPPSRIKEVGEQLAETGKRYAGALGAGFRGAKEGWEEKAAEREAEKAKKKKKGKKEKPAKKGPRLQIDLLRAKKEREEKEKREVKRELDKIPENQREKLSFGLSNLGFFVEEQKDKFFAETFKRASKLIGEKGATKKFWEVLGKNFEKDAERARKNIEAAKKGKKKRLASAGYLAGNVLKYGRTLTDVLGYTLGSPLRYVMMSGMFFARGAEAAKETRLQNEEVIEKTRVNDINKASEEAWKVYEEAKTQAGGERISKEDLENAYQRNVPQDLLDRLKRKPDPGVGNGILQKIIRKDIELSVKSINEKIEKIEIDESLSKEEKETKKERILNRYSRHLKTLDRAVSQYGTVDGLAVGAKYTETAAKTVVAGIMAETVVRGVQALWEWRFADILSDRESALPPVTEVPAEVSPEAITSPETPGPETAIPEAETPVEIPTVPLDTTEVPAAPLETEEITREPETVEPAEAPVEEQAPETEVERGVKEIPPSPVEPREIDVSQVEKMPGGPLSVEDIRRQENVLREWAQSHPGEEITPEKEVEILREAGLEPIILGEEIGAASPEEYIETIEKGDSVWSTTEDQLEKHFGNAFTNLDEAKRTYIIDAIKDKIVADPEKYGLVGVGDIDNLEAGSKIDFSSVFRDRAEMENIFGKAGVLTEAQIENIERNNQVLREWVREHPEEQLTSEKVDEILTEAAQKPTAPIIETEPKIEEIERPAPESRETPLEEIKPIEQPEVTTGERVAPETQPPATQEVARGEFIIPDSEHLTGGRIRFAYGVDGSVTGLEITNAQLRGFNPYDKLREDWFDAFRERLAERGNKNEGLQRSALLAGIRDLEVRNKFLEALTKGSREAEFLARTIGRAHQLITANFGDVLKP